MDKNDLLLEQWKMASELHRHEDNLIWQKFNYFVTINSILISALAIIWSTNYANTNVQPRFVSIILALFGIVICAFWSLIQKRGQLYQNYRIAQAKRIEQLLTLEEKQILDLYQAGLDQQKLVKISKSFVFSAQDLVFWLTVGLTVWWLVTLIYFWCL